MVEGSVATTCRAAGMRHVCPGSSTCRYNSPRWPICFESPLSPAGCTYFTHVSDHICGTTDAKQCPILYMMFQELNTGQTHGLLGSVASGMAYGNTYISGEGGVFYYAYCAICEDCSGDSELFTVCRDINFSVVAWSLWSTCGTSCRRNRTRSCTGSSACEEFETDDEECNDENCDPSEHI